MTNVRFALAETEASAGAHDLLMRPLQLAARRLRTSAESVAQITDAVGYGAVAAFSRAFKRHTGLSPQQWRSPTMTLAAELPSRCI